MANAPAKFTPGPWKVKRTRTATGAGTINGAVIHDGHVNVAYVTRTADKPIPQKEADAHLIAAAPDMYEALKALVNEHSAPYYGPGTVRKAQWEAAKSAIAKAEGRNA